MFLMILRPQCASMTSYEALGGYMHNGLNKGLRVLILSILFVAVSCQFHEIDKGKFYRSPQLTLEQLHEANKNIGFKTIINLRGKNSGQSWYDDESGYAESNGIHLVNISMSAKSIPSRQNLIRLLDAYAASPRPMLVHCRAGVDRTGEASAIYAMLYMGQTKQQALAMLSSKYGYVDGVSPKAKKYFIEKVWQGEEWARNEYYPCKQNYEYFDKASQCDKDGNEIPNEKSPDDDDE